MSKQHYLLTGGAGFIGSHLAKALLAKGDARITCIDNFDPFYPRYLKLQHLQEINTPDFHLIETDLDLLSPNQLLDLIPERIDSVLHFAAKAGVRPSINRPEAYIQTNVRSTERLLEFAVKKKVERFVFASSSSVYGINQNLPWKEDALLRPISPYAATKVAGEAMGHVYSQLYGLKFIALRLFTVYGPGMRPDLAIHKFFKSILEGTPVKLFGDGSSSRDYTYIDDIVAGIIAASKLNEVFEVINLGNNQPVLLQDLIKLIENITTKKASIQSQPQQLGDVAFTLADISKAQKLLHYQPQTSVEAGLAKVYEWFKTHEALLLAYQ